VLVGDESPPPPPPTNTLRADAFTLATAGLANGSTLESWGSQATAVDSSVDISHPTYTQTDKIIVGTSIAFKINPQADCTISDLSLSIKV
ncbi:hypothetical protein, partial [Salmonella enterica]|uniref:hypothetical protein n=1 Tax=Salmonella enterica TaxID=28901 RepID=UPI003D2A17B6